MTRMTNRTKLLITVAAGALLLPVAALAQDAPPSAPEAAVAGDDEIVVTAQKREERLQDVPISISVVGGAQMQQSGGSQLTDYAAYVPGFQVDNAGSPGRSTLSLRGVAPIGPSATVGMYLDDAPIGSSGIYNRAQTFSLDLMPYDIAQLEVLRGPQGTLYGASSIGGLLKYVTVQPDLNSLSVRAGGEIFTIAHGSDMGWAANAMVNVPLVSDKLAVSASYSRRETPGYIDNIFTGEKDVNDAVQQGGRVALLWKPDSNLTIKLSGLWQSVGSGQFRHPLRNADLWPAGARRRLAQHQFAAARALHQRLPVLCRHARLRFRFCRAELNHLIQQARHPRDQRCLARLWRHLGRAR